MDYLKIYRQIIGNARNRKLKSYTERHHIVPICMGGNNDKSNLVDLTPREHYICHKLLCEIYPDVNELFVALWLMSIGKRRPKNTDKFTISSREYERLKLKFITISKQKRLNEKQKRAIGVKNGTNVHQFDLQGNFIKTWQTCQDAERYYNNKTGDNISACCRGAQKTAYGFIWNYNLIDIKPIEVYMNKRQKKVWQVK